MEFEVFVDGEVSGFFVGDSADVKATGSTVYTLGRATPSATTEYLTGHVDAVSFRHEALHPSMVRSLYSLTSVAHPFGRVGELTEAPRWVSRDYKVRVRRCDQEREKFPTYPARLATWREGNPAGRTQGASTRQHQPAPASTG